MEEASMRFTVQATKPGYDPSVLALSATQGPAQTAFEEYSGLSRFRRTGWTVELWDRTTPAEPIAQTPPDGVIHGDAADTVGMEYHLNLSVRHLHPHTLDWLLSGDAPLEVHTYDGAADLFLYCPQHMQDPRFIDGEALPGDLIALLAKARELGCRIAAIGPAGLERADLPLYETTVAAEPVDQRGEAFRQRADSAGVPRDAYGRVIRVGANRYRVEAVDPASAEHPVVLQPLDRGPAARCKAASLVEALQESRG